MRSKSKPIVILLADDDEEDRMLARDALAESRLSNAITCVTDGEDLMDYLLRRGKYAPPAEAFRPGFDPARLKYAEKGRARSLARDKV
jgi:CheY-like chemotaxis protein